LKETVADLTITGKQGKELQLENPIQHIHEHSMNEKLREAQSQCGL
jgi:hypothetical protein